MATKKTASKKSPIKKTATKKRNTSTKSSQVKSFRLTRPDRPFWSFVFTTQSFYWILIGASVIAVGIYVATLQIRVNSLYDQLDTNSAQAEINGTEIKKINESLKKSD